MPIDLSEVMELVDTVDVPTLAIGVLYGFWKVIHVLNTIERALLNHLHEHDVRIVKLETLGGMPK